MSTWLVSAAFRHGRHGIGLLLLGAMAACQSGEATPPDAAPAALDSADPTAADSSDAAQGTVTFSIDGQPEPGVSCVLTDRGAEKGFLLSFSSEQLWEVGIVQTDKSPLIVGKVAILDGNSSPAYATATLPSRFNKEAPEGHRDYISFVGLTESGADYLNVYDWGAGIRRLTDREVGQVVFTRISNGTADGSFQSAVYLEPVGVKMVQHQGKDRILHQTKEHLLKGAFKNVPVFDMQKALNGGG